MNRYAARCNTACKCLSAITPWTDECDRKLWEACEKLITGKQYPINVSKLRDYFVSVTKVKKVAFSNHSKMSMLKYIDRSDIELTKRIQMAYLMKLELTTKLEKDMEAHGTLFMKPTSRRLEKFTFFGAKLPLVSPIGYQDSVLAYPVPIVPMPIGRGGNANQPDNDVQPRPSVIVASGESSSSLQMKNAVPPGQRQPFTMPPPPANGQPDAMIPVNGVPNIPMPFPFFNPPRQMSTNVVPQFDFSAMSRHFFAQLPCFGSQQQQIPNSNYVPIVGNQPILGFDNGDQPSTSGNPIVLQTPDNYVLPSPSTSAPSTSTCAHGNQEQHSTAAHQSGAMHTHLPAQSLLNLPAIQADLLRLAAQQAPDNALPTTSSSNIGGQASSSIQPTGDENGERDEKEEGLQLKKEIKEEQISRSRKRRAAKEQEVLRRERKYGRCKHHPEETPLISAFAFLTNVCQFLESLHHEQWRNTNLDLFVKSIEAAMEERFKEFDSMLLDTRRTRDLVDTAVKGIRVESMKEKIIDKEGVIEIDSALESDTDLKDFLRKFWTFIESFRWHLPDIDQFYDVIEKMLEEGVVKNGSVIELDKMVMSLTEMPNYFKFVAYTFEIDLGK